MVADRARARSCTGAGRRLKRAVAAFLDEHLADRAERLFVALSGGADSVLLLTLLAELARDGAVPWVIALHVNHGARTESDRDESFCRELCDRLGIELRVARLDVAEVREHERSAGREAAWRRARYEALWQMVGDAGGGELALGHTADDQAETVLGCLVTRGGPVGLQAMSPASGGRLRPLLAVRRDEVRQALEEMGQDWREDVTNADEALLRPWIRERLLPLLTERNPRVVEHLAELARLQRADQDELERLAAVVWPDVARQNTGGAWIVDRSAYRGQQRALRYRLLRIAAAGADDHPLAARLVFACDELAMGRDGSERSLDMPGRVVFRCSRDRIWFERASTSEQEA